MILNVKYNPPLAYLHSVVQSYPHLLTISQLRLAFTTLVSCISEKDENLAWLCLTKLMEAISSISVTAPLGTSPKKEQVSQETLANLPENQKQLKPANAQGAAVDSLLDEPPTRLEDSLSTNRMEAAALKSRRGHFLLALIDQSTAVTLPLLVPVLDRIVWFLAEEADSSPASRQALTQVLFQTVASGMDMTKRETAAKWYLNRRPEIEELEMTGYLQAHL